MQGEVHGTDTDGDGAFRLLAGAQGGLLVFRQDDGLAEQLETYLPSFTVSLASGRSSSAACR